MIGVLVTPEPRDLTDPEERNVTMQWKTILALACGLALAIVMGACAGSSDGPTGDSDSSGLDTTGSSGIGRAAVLLGSPFETIDGLTAGSDAVVLGTVTSIKYEELEHRYPITIVKLRVEQALKGNVKRGEELVISEPGGMLAGLNKADPGAYVEPAEVAAEGVPVMKASERWLLFLAYDDQCHSAGPVAGPCWRVLNVLEGKFRVGDDERIVFTGYPPDVDQDGSAFSVHKQVEGRTVTELLAEIDAVLKP